MKQDFVYLLNALRQTTASMTPEKFDYLKKNTKLSPVDLLRIKKYRKAYSDFATLEEFIERFEYETRFRNYEKSWEKAWSENKNDESLAAYADSALNQAVSQNSKTI